MHGAMNAEEYGKLVHWDWDSHPDAENDASGFVPLAVITAEALYKRPVGMDFLHLAKVLEARVLAAEDYTWSLREGLAYFSEQFREILYHREEMLPDTKVFAILFSEVLICIEYEQSSRNSIDPVKDLPTIYFHALTLFKFYLDQAVMVPLEQPEHPEFASPPMRFEDTSVYLLLSQPQTLRRTPEWVEPAKTNSKAESITNRDLWQLNKPLSKLVLDELAQKPKKFKPEHKRVYLATLITQNENENPYHAMEQEKCLYMMKETVDGHGLFAKELIKAGTRIIHEKPILTVSQAETKTKAEYTCVVDQVADLSDSEKQRLMDLYHNNKKLREFSFLQGQPCPGTDLDAGIVLAKFYTNAASITSGGLECGLFTIFCRMNHSCTPNTCWVYDEPTGFMEVYAVRDIDKDEEITNSYIEVAISHQARMQELSNWGFRCQCTACEGPDAAKHNERRRRIAQIKGILDIYQDTGKSGDAPKFAEIPKTDLEALRLGEESLTLLSDEGLIEQLGVMYGLCAKFAKGAGLHDFAENYEEMEFEILVITTGEYID
ncbi:SET domain-containing 5 [Fusarium acutatum]|uniref:SET domain-containing 5 n=1 Tax=Fusarium acutatum TaxID=78861 RepID=A0A8H4JHN8_9HYPO|nr:SET domain-containing 5 [Fusarium acutatum]